MRRISSIRHPQSTIRNGLAFAALLASLSFAPAGAPAASGTWTQTGGGDWNVNGNWTGATFPNGIDQSATLGSSITGNANIELDTNITLGTLNFDDNNNYTITQSVGTTIAFDVTAGNAALNVTSVNGSGSHAISNTRIALHDFLDISVGSGLSFTINSRMNQNVAGSGVNKNGDGTLTLTRSTGGADNDYTGLTQVNAGVFAIGGSFGGDGAIRGNITVNNTGTFRLLQSNIIINSSAVTVNSGGVFDLNGFSDLVGSLVLNGSGIGGTGALLNNGAASTGLNSTVSLATTSTIGGSGNITIGQVISGGGGLTKAGTGTLTLTGANTYNGPTVINAGTLTMIRATTNATSGITVNTGGTLNYNSNGSTWPFPANAVSLSGGTLSFSASGLTGKYGSTTAATTVSAPSFITVQSLGGSATPPNHSNLFMDAGLKGSADVTVTSFTNGLGAVLRNANSTYSGHMTVNGNASTVAGTGSGAAIDQTALMSSADITVNGTLEIGGGATGLGWASSAATGQTVQIDALSGTGVVVANMLSGTRTLSVGNNGGTGGNFSGQIANGAGNTLSLTKTGSGTQELSGNNTYTGTTNVNQGKLLVNGTHTGGGLYTVASGATLGGSGMITTLVQGSGLISPGNSPGILTMTQADVSTGLDFAFEFTQTGDPDWSNALSSDNDVFRLTHATNPLIGGLFDSDNVIDIYLGVASVNLLDVFRGGIYTDKNQDFLATIAGADYNFWILGDGAGTTTTFNSQGYYDLGSYAGRTLAVSTYQVPIANFAGGNINNGWVMEFTVVVPEPSTYALGLIGLVALACRAWAGRGRK